jgi:hypothetical protein
MTSSRHNSARRARGTFPNSGPGHSGFAGASERIARVAGDDLPRLVDLDPQTERIFSPLLRRNAEAV